MKSTEEKSKIKGSQSNRADKSCEQTKLNFSKIANSTINRQTILSKLSKDQILQFTKQKRNLNRYKQYQQYWSTQSTKFKTLLSKKRESLLQSSTTQLVVCQNPSKDDLISNHIVHYWQMSLRNHDAVLKRHIKGHSFGQVQVQQLLQGQDGRRQVQDSIPRLPIESLRKIKRRDLSLTGRAKLPRQSQSLTQRSSFRQKQLMNQQEVYKINYKGDKTWQGNEAMAK